MIKLQRFVDRFIGNILCNLFWPFKPQKKNIFQPKKILIVKLWAVGESILTLPLISELKKKYPNTQIDVLVRKRNKDIYTLNKNIGAVLLLNKKNVISNFKKYDLVFDCEPYLNISAILSFWLGKQTIGFSHGQRAKLYNYKIKYNDQQHVVKTYLDLLIPICKEIKNPKKLVKLEYSLYDLEIINKLLKSYSLDDKKLIGICATAAESAHSRMWPKEKFAKLIDKLVSEKNVNIILVGGKNDSALNESIIKLVTNKEKVFNFAGKTSVKQLFALVEKCEVFISNDTGPMHVAAAQDVKTIGLFGPNTPVRFGPYGEKNSSIYKPVLPKPCINVHLGKVPDCKNHNHMSLISVNDVYEAI